MAEHIYKIKSAPLFRIKAEVAAAQEAESGPYGDVRYMPVKGGTFEGERLRGKLLPGGADCQLIRQDNVADINVRVVMETDDGVRFLMRGFGLRHASEDVMRKLMAGEAVPAKNYYFRETFFFETPSGKYDWLNRLIGIGGGERNKDGVVLDVYELK